MATVADLWGEPEVKPKGGTSDVIAPKQKSFSTYKGGIEINEPMEQPQGATIADLWETTPTATKEELKKHDKGVFASALENAFKAREMFRGAVAEPVATLTTGAQAGVIGPLTGLVAAARSGKFGTQQGVVAGRQQAENYAQQTTYQPKTETGKAIVGKIGEIGQTLAGAGPVPELYAFGPLAEGHARQAATTAKAWKSELPTVRIEKAPKATVEAQMADQLAAKQAPAGSVGSAKVEFNPYAGQITGEESARGQFPQVKLSKTTQDVAPTEQATRASIAKEILEEGGVDSSQVRPGVVTGNENTLRNEHTEAKSANPTPKSELLKSQIANEQIALSNYAQKRIENTGASPTLVTPYERGERINSTFAGDEGISGFIKGEKQKLYDEVATQVGGNPIQASNVDELFSNKQFKAGLGLKGNEGVAKSAEELINLAKTIGFQDEMGNVHAPNTIGAWIAVQKALNSEWSPSNAKIIRTINQAIERDIGQAGGLEMLKKADSLHQAEKVLFGSKGIKQIFGDIDPNGVQTATAFEAIPQKLNSMPVDQWKHIYETAEKVAKGTIDGPIDKATGLPKWSIQVPDELRVSAQSAVNEMRGNIAREIYQAGAAKAGEWNQNAVNKILNARADKIKLAFSPEEQKAFHTLNVGGYLMPGVHSYEGAGLQGQRVQGIIEHNLPKAGAAAGAAVGGAIAGPTGAAVGGYLGGKAGMAGQEKIALGHMTKEAEKLKQQMQNTAKLGTKLSDIKPTRIELKGMANKEK